MTTTIIGQLPALCRMHKCRGRRSARTAPECNTIADLKSVLMRASWRISIPPILGHNGRKHTLKCSVCGVLAYYQSQAAKAQIMRRLHEHSEGIENLTAATIKSTAITLQLPERNMGKQRYTLTLEPVGIVPVDGQRATVDSTEPAANDEQGRSSVVSAGRAETTDEQERSSVVGTAPTDEQEDNDRAKPAKDNRGFFSALEDFELF